MVSLAWFFLIALCVNFFDSLCHLLYSKLDVNFRFLLLGSLVWLFPAYRMMHSIQCSFVWLIPAYTMLHNIYFWQSLPHGWYDISLVFHIQNYLFLLIANVDFHIIMYQVVSFYCWYSQCVTNPCIQNNAQHLLFFVFVFFVSLTIVYTH